ncbi:hypothetical protein GMDG_03387 [Pseudogymnoascus destructans 20631-21]|uniref:Uncharacterized protein n=1 Tax=Pseudogymnoascus destructans (strain ATCC MYA-4855 / 20631-21) TaxID=658429 RepID=L8G633_PSED2|nr:hypothetical protein GMDG_03387 [Pseudogymnoascus destructans 20631-21]
MHRAWSLLQSRGNRQVTIGMVSQSPGKQAIDSTTAPYRRAFIPKTRRQAFITDSCTCGISSCQGRSIDFVNTYSQNRRSEHSPVQQKQNLSSSGRVRLPKPLSHPSSSSQPSSTRMPKKVVSSHDSSTTQRAEIVISACPLASELSGKDRTPTSSYKSQNGATASLT